MPTTNPWDTFADAYARTLEQRAPADAPGGMIDRLIALLGDLDGKTALDAACGPGVLARVMANRGAHVTGIDLSPRLIAQARDQDPDGAIDYRVGDLSRPQPDLENRFDAIGSHLALNDVEHYREFAQVLASLLKPGGRLALAFNNPYSLIVRGNLPDYFDPDAMGTYFGMWEQGIEARYYHRTLEAYLDAFLDAGLRLFKLVDVPSHLEPEPLPGGFPKFMILAFEKP